MRAPKGGAGPRLIITNPQPSNPLGSVPSPRPRLPSQRGPADAPSTMGGTSSSRMSYLQQLSTASIQNASRRATPVVYSASPQAAHRQRQPIQENRLAGFRTESVASQMSSPAPSRRGPSRECSPRLDYRFLSGSSASRQHSARSLSPAASLTIPGGRRVLQGVESPTLSVSLSNSREGSSSRDTSRMHDFSRAVSPQASGRGSSPQDLQVRDVSPRTHDQAWGDEPAWGGILWGAGETSTRLVSFPSIVSSLELTERLGLS